jgi:hypothetical protein
MKIINCPKGGRVPEGYCKQSCLNYPGKNRMEKWILARKSRVLPKLSGKESHGEMDPGAKIKKHLSCNATDLDLLPPPEQSQFPGIKSRLRSKLIFIQSYSGCRSF